MKQERVVLTALLCVGVLLVLTAGASAIDPLVFYRTHALKGNFDTWARLHNRAYGNDKIGARFQVWLNNKAIVDRHNAMAGRKYTMALNDYSDLSFDEFRAKFLIATVNQPDIIRSAPVQLSSAAVNTSSRVSLQASDAPASIDWRKKGAVTPVKSQYGGTCWIYGTVAVLETTWALSGRGLSVLSEQQILDCNTNGAGDEVHGGWPDRALDWVINLNKGMIMSDHRYKQTGPKTNCLYSADQQQATGEARFMKYVQNGGSEDDLVRIIGNRPAVICMNVQESFQQYSSGVYDESDCERHGENGHCFAIMGYGTDNGQDYWLIKNSWGSGWGESGYMRFIRGVNRCNIQAATYVVSHPDGPKGFSTHKVIVGEPGESCTIACARQGRKCTLPINTFSSDEMFKMNGIDCTHDQRGLFAADQPSFVSESSDPYGNYRKCLGVAQDSSSSTTCDFSYYSVRRLCRCEALLDRDYIMGGTGQTCSQACSSQRNTGCDTNVEDLDFTWWNKVPSGYQNPGWDWCCADQPCYVAGSGDQNYNRVLGLNARPRWRDCDGSYPTVNPLCHCRPRFYLGMRGEDCDKTCQRQGMQCEPIYPGDMGNSVKPFNDLGINCDTSAGSSWFANDQPAWVTDPNDPNKFYNKCLGFQNVPRGGAPCNAKFWSVSRLCKCHK